MKSTKTSFAITSLEKLQEFLRELESEFSMTNFAPVINLIEIGGFRHDVDFHVHDEGSWGLDMEMTLKIKHKKDHDHDVSGDIYFHWRTSSNHEITIKADYYGKWDVDKIDGTITLGDDTSEYFYPRVIAIIKEVVSEQKESQA